MGRRERHDADFFPFFVKDGKTLFLLKHLYGLAGIGFFTELFRFLTRTPDHYICIADEIDRLRFYAAIGCAEEIGRQMIETMVKTEKLDKFLWEQKQIIASEDLLNSLAPLYERRKMRAISVDIIATKNGLLYPEMPISVDINRVSVPRNALKQSRVEERRGEEIPPLPVDNSRREEAEILVAEFYAALSKKIGRKICPGDDEDILAEKLLEKQEASLDDASGMIPVYLSCTDWWMYDRADKAREHPLYSFTAFCKHYTDLMTKPKPRERKRVGIPCPKCGEGILVGDPPYCSAECGYGEGTDKAGSATTEDPDDW